MNILLISHELSVTGAPNSLLRQACYFRDAGHSVDIFSLKDGNIKERYIEEGFNPIIIENSQSAIADAYYKQNKKYDFILCNTTVSYKAVDFLQHQNVPLVWFIRETRLVDIGMENDKDFAKVFKDFYNIYTVSDYAATVCKKYNRHIRIINNAVADNFTQFKTVTDKIVFGFIGQISREKGMKYLLDAFNKLTTENSNTELYIAGDYNHQFAQELQNMNVPRVRWLGEVQKQDKENFFNSIDILIVPSLDEPSGLTVIEGAMYGKPIITTKKTGAKYIVKNKKSGFIIKPGNTQDLYRHMKRILNSDLFAMSKISRNMYLKFGTIDKERKSVIQMLHKNENNIPSLKKSKFRIWKY